jgi:hypothetical protein
VTTADALRDLARHAALTLIAQELRGIIAPPVTVTIHPQASPKLLRAKRGRPKGKPKKRAAAAPLERRLCRSCWKRGGVRRVPGTERTLECTSCKFKWEGRGLGKTRAKKRLTPSVPAGACFRCDHPADKHPGGGACITPRCSCESLYQ